MCRHLTRSIGSKLSAHLTRHTLNGCRQLPSPNIFGLQDYERILPTTVAISLPLNPTSIWTTFYYLAKGWKPAPIVLLLHLFPSFATLLTCEVFTGYEDKMYKMVCSLDPLIFIAPLYDSTGYSKTYPSLKIPSKMNWIDVWLQLCVHKEWKSYSLFQSPRRAEWKRLINLFSNKHNFHGQLISENIGQARELECLLSLDL